MQRGEGSRREARQEERLGLLPECPKGGQKLSKLLLLPTEGLQSLFSCGRAAVELLQESDGLAEMPLPKVLLKAWFSSRDLTHSLTLHIFKLLTGKAQEGREEKLLGGKATTSTQTCELKH